MMKPNQKEFVNFSKKNKRPKMSPSPIYFLFLSLQGLRGLLLPIVFVFDVLLGLAWWSTHRTEYMVFAGVFSLLHLDTILLQAELQVIRPLFSSALSILDHSQNKYVKLVVLQNICSRFISIRYFEYINVWMGCVQCVIPIFVHYLKTSDRAWALFGYREFMFFLCVFDTLLALDFMGRCVLVSSARTENLRLRDTNETFQDVGLLPTTRWMKYKMNVVLEEKRELVGFAKEE